MYTVYDVLRAIDYPALDRIVGDNLITGLPCPVVEHRNQNAVFGPAACHPPKTDDPGTLICNNCGESWSAKGLAIALAIEKNVKEGKRPEVKSLVVKAPVEPVDVQKAWSEAFGHAQTSKALATYLMSRWGDKSIAGMAKKFVGWTADMRGRYFGKSHHLFIPCYNAAGEMVTGVRRLTTGLKAAKSKRLSNAAVGLERGAAVFFGDTAAEVMRRSPSSTLWICEGEIDTILMLALRELGHISGAIVGAPGSSAKSTKWWRALANMLTKPPPKDIVTIFDSDETGDKYYTMSQECFPGAQRVPLPDEMDLTDIMVLDGHKEVLQRLNSARTAMRNYYILDNGRYAYRINGTWELCRSAVSIKARMRSAGHTVDEAAAMAQGLPPAADVCFDPSTINAVVLREDNTYLNTWRGLPIKGSSGRFDLIHRLLMQLCGNCKRTFNYVCDWLARPLQGIARGKILRNRTALIFFGAQGTGKGLFFDGVMRHIYGRYHFGVNHRNLEDAFEPEKLSKSLFLVANEVADSTLRNTKVLNVLKNWVADDMISIRQMNVTAREFPVYFNMVITSNHSAPIRLESSDRRYTCIRTDTTVRSDPNFERDIVLERDSGWPTAECFYQFLIEREIQDDVCFPLSTEWRSALIEAGRPSQETFAMAIAEDGFNSIAEDWVAEAYKKGRDGPFYIIDTGFVPTATLSEVYHYWCRQHGVRHPVRSLDLAAAVYEQLLGAGFLVEREQHQVGTKRCRGIANVPMFQVDETVANKQKAREVMRQITKDGMYQ